MYDIEEEIQITIIPPWAIAHYTVHTGTHINRSHESQLQLLFIVFLFVVRHLIVSFLGFCFGVFW